MAKQKFHEKFFRDEEYTDPTPEEIKEGDKEFEPNKDSDDKHKEKQESDKK